LVEELKGAVFCEVLRRPNRKIMIVTFATASYRVVVGPAPCHLRPSDKKRLAVVSAAKRAESEQRALSERISLLQVSCD